MHLLIKDYYFVVLYLNSGIIIMEIMTMNYGGSKFKGLRDKERKVNYSNDRKTDEEKLLEEFEKMLEQEDFSTFDPDFNYPVFPDSLDLEYPEEPPPIPKKAKKEKDGCKHEKTKKVYYTQNKAYIMCLKCKADLGDA